MSFSPFLSFTIRCICWWDSWANPTGNCRLSQNPRSSTTGPRPGWVQASARWTWSWSAHLLGASSRTRFERSSGRTAGHGSDSVQAARVLLHAPPPIYDMPKMTILLQTRKEMGPTYQLYSRNDFFAILNMFDVPKDVTYPKRLFESSVVSNIFTLRHSSVDV